MAHRKGFSEPPEMLLPSQLFDTRAGQTARSPECRLIAAVLLDAALQLSRHGSKGAADAERWIRRTDGSDEAFSFVGVCEALRLEPTYLARGLFRWRRRSCRHVTAVVLRACAVSRGRKPRRRRVALDAVPLVSRCVKLSCGGDHTTGCAGYE